MSEPVGASAPAPLRHVEEVMGPSSIAVVVAMIATGLVVWGVVRRRGRRDPDGLA